MNLLCRLALGVRMSFDWFMSMVDGLFNKHKLVRRSIVYFALYEIYCANREVLPRLDGGNLLAAYGLVVGILATVITFYQWLRNKDGD